MCLYVQFILFKTLNNCSLCILCTDVCADNKLACDAHKETGLQWSGSLILHLLIHLSPGKHRFQMFKGQEASSESKQTFGRLHPHHIYWNALKRNKGWCLNSKHTLILAFYASRACSADSIWLMLVQEVGSLVMSGRNAHKSEMIPLSQKKCSIPPCSGSHSKLIHVVVTVTIF